MLTVSAATLDAFDDGTTLGWEEGRSPNPPEFVASGGPAGDGDGFLRNVSDASAGGGAGSNFVMLNEADQWIGDYLSEGIVAIQADIANFGSEPLPLRIALATGQGSGSRRDAWFATTDAVTIPANGEWQTVTFTIDTSGLTQVSGTLSLDEVLTDVTEFRLLASESADFRGDTLTTTVGFDNIQALDELSTGPDFHNDADPVDVDNSGVVTPLDALLVINELNNRVFSDAITGALNPDAMPTVFLDVDDDGLMTPRDALLVINTLNANAANAPTANGDAGFTVAASDTLNIDIADLLANDTGANTFTLQSIGNSALGATVSLVNDQIVYTPSGSTTLSNLSAAEDLTDSFSYTIEDSDGLTSTGQVSVRVLGQESVRFRFEAVDTAGNPIDTIQTGANFGLAVYVEDVRNVPTGVFSPYLDIRFDSDLVTAQGSFDFGPQVTFPDTEPGKFAQDGLVDEAGAFLSFDAVDSGEVLVFTIPFTAGQTTGGLAFVGDPADVPELHDLTYSGSGDIIPANQVAFGRETLRIVDASFAALANAAVDDVFPDS